MNYMYPNPAAGAAAYMYPDPGKNALQYMYPKSGSAKATASTNLMRDAFDKDFGW